MQHPAARVDPRLAVRDGLTEAPDRRRHQQAAGPGKRERHPAERVWEVGAVEVRVGRPRGGEPEQDREGGAHRRSEAEREAGEGADADGDLGQRDPVADDDGERLDGPDEEGDRRHARELDELGLDRTRAGGVEEGRVEELVEARVDEGDAEEQTQRQEGEGRDGRAGHALAQRGAHRNDALRAATT